MKYKIIVLIVLLLFVNWQGYAIGSKTIAERLVKEGERYLQAGNVSAAMVKFEAAKQEYPEYHRIYYNLARIKLKENSLPEAKKYIKKALTYQKFNREYRNMYSSILLKEAENFINSGAETRAFKLIEKIKRENEEFPNVYVFLANHYIKQSNFKEAERELRNLQELNYRNKVKFNDPIFVNGLVLKAYIRFKQGKYYIALKEFEKAERANAEAEYIKKYKDIIKGESNPFFVHFSKGKSYFEKKEWTKALEEFTAAKKYNAPVVADFIKKIEDEMKFEKLISMADKEFAARRYKAALEYYTKTLQYKDNEKAKKRIEECNRFISLAKLQARQREIKKNTVIELITETQRQAGYYLRLGKEALSLGELESFKKAYEYFQKSKKLYLTLTPAQKSKMDKDFFKINEYIKSAKQAYEKLKEEKENYLKGKECYKTKKYSQAIKYLSSIPEKKEYAKLKLIWGICYANINQPKKALKYLYSYLKENKGDIEAISYIAKIKFENNEIDEAEKLLTSTSADHPLKLEILNKIKTKREEEASAKMWKKIYIGIGIVVGLILLKILSNLYTQMAEKKREEARKKASGVAEVEEMLKKKAQKAMSSKEIIRKLQRAKTLIQKNAYDSAIKEAQEVLNASPKNKNAIVILATCYQKKGVFTEETLPIFEEFYKLYPDKLSFAKCLCECYISVNKFTPVTLRVFRKVLQKEPDNTRIKEICEKYKHF